MNPSVAYIVKTVKIVKQVICVNLSLSYCFFGGPHLAAFRIARNSTFCLFVVDNWRRQRLGNALSKSLQSQHGKTMENHGACGIPERL